MGDDGACSGWGVEAGWRDGCLSVWVTAVWVMMVCLCVGGVGRG